MESRVLIANGLIAATVAILIVVPLVWWVRALVAKRRRRNRRRDNYRPYFSNAPVPRPDPRTTPGPRKTIEQPTPKATTPAKPKRRR